jgi:hypothetical protein
MARKEGKIHSQPITITPSLHIPSHIMQQTATNLTRKSRRGSKRKKTHEISYGSQSMTSHTEIAIDNEISTENLTSAKK